MPGLTEGAVEKKKLRYPVVVEGKYDKIKIDSLFEAQVLVTGGFAVYNDREKRALIRRLGEKTPVIFLTDSDAAGRQIRNRLRDLIPADKQIHLYVPQVAGKEKRKQAPSAEGILGVEGSDKDLLRSLLSPYAVDAPPHKQSGAPLTRAELYERGYAGAENSAAKRKELLARCRLPANLSTSAMIDALNLLYSREELDKLL